MLIIVSQYARISGIAIFGLLIVATAAQIVVAQDTAMNSSQERLPEFAIRRFGSFRFLPRNAANRIEYSADGKYVATVSASLWGTNFPRVQIWERSSGSDVTPRELKDLDANEVSWAADGKRFVTCPKQSQPAEPVCIWKIGSDTPVTVLKQQEPVHSIDWSPKGETLALAMENGDIVICDTNGRVRKRIHAQVAIDPPVSKKLVDFDPDGKRVAAIDKNGVSVYQLSTGTLTVQVDLPGQSLWAVRFLSDGMSIGVASGSNVMLYDLKTLSFALKLDGKWSFDFAVSPDGKWLATSGKFAAIWDIKTSKKTCALSENEEGGVAFAPDGSEVASGSRRISFRSTEDWLPKSNESNCALFTGILRNDCIWVGGHGHIIRKVDLNTAREIKTINRRSGNTQEICEIDERRMAVIGDQSSIEVFDIETGELIFELPGHLRLSQG